MSNFQPSTFLNNPFALKWISNLFAWLIHIKSLVAKKDQQLSLTTICWQRKTNHKRHTLFLYQISKKLKLIFLINILSYDFHGRKTWVLQSILVITIHSLVFVLQSTSGCIIQVPLCWKSANAFKNPLVGEFVMCVPKLNIYVHQLLQKYVYDVGISSCWSNPSYEIGLNKWCCNDGEIDHFKYI